MFNRLRGRNWHLNTPETSVQAFLFLQQNDVPGHLSVHLNAEVYSFLGLQEPSEGWKQWQDVLEASEVMYGWLTLEVVKQYSLVM